ncbi:orotate phosphoribosyltransferase [bacterium B17]|nr:orotate phosphoribosyltransferase [bacterium B17]
MDEKEVLNIFRESGALLEGHFELRSGLHSGSFFQCAEVLCYPRLAEQLCAELVRRIQAELGDAADVDTVVAPAMGGIAVGHEVGRAMNKRSIFIEKQDGVLVMRRFKVAEGERVIIAEDVVTRGGRVQESIDILEKSGAKIEAIALLVDRSGGKASFDYPTFSLLKMEPVAYELGNCPLCDEGLELVHPGS